MSSEFVATACPHDCPSTCALEVERLAPDRIGAVRGARENDYTSGVICAKVAPLPPSACTIRGASLSRCSAPARRAPARSAPLAGTTRST